MLLPSSAVRADYCGVVNEGNSTAVCSSGIENHSIDLVITKQ